jgi:glycosyltransferase involved in cell wall biosynthesis
MQNKTVAILLATYQPREDWLIQLLDSLNSQSYPYLKLYVRDDASPTYPLNRLEQLLRTHITAFPFVLLQNAQNQGSNATFAALVEDCEENYIAFCDQDDVWDSTKIENTLGLLLESPLHPTLVCANVRVIDGEGKPIAATMEEHRRRHVYLRGENLAPTLIYRNFVMGCTVIMERSRALSYLPFPTEVVHDHYLAFRAAADGAIDYLKDPQMQYRVYGGNQTGVMTGVDSKESYFTRRILAFEKRVQAFGARVNLPKLEEAVAWSQARCANFHREKGAFSRLYRLRGVNPATTYFELFALRAPTPLFRFALRLIKKGVL